MGGWKEFLKPTPLKIILFVLFPFFYAQTGQIYCIMAPCPQPFGMLPLVFAVFSYAENGLNPIFLIGAIPSYLLACILEYFRNKKSEGKRPAAIKLFVVLTILLSIIALAISIIGTFQSIRACPDCRDGFVDDVLEYPQIFFLLFSVVGFACSILLAKTKKTGPILSIVVGAVSIVLYYFTGFNSNMKELWFLTIVMWAYLIFGLVTKRKFFFGAGSEIVNENKGNL